ncbi:CHAT domain-containing protein [Cellulomonas sp. NPDC055163]
MVEPFADLEIALRWKDDDRAFDVGLRYVRSDQNVDEWEHPDELLLLDLEQLALHANDVDRYAAELSRAVFREDVATFYDKSRARSQGTPMHVRLTLDAPPTLHRVRWELLRDPREDHPVATAPDVLFSRYLTSADFRTVRWSTRRASRALVAISSPTDIESFTPNGRPLARVEVDKERRYAEQALTGIQTVFLDGGGTATLANIARELAKDIDILYLVCHGALLTDVPMIFLEHPDGTAHDVDARRLQEMVASLPRRPTLALLSSCQSAGPGGAETTTDEGVLAGLGPRLAAAGVATVIAMQGNVAVDTARRFAERFFTELQDDGVIDRSVQAARRVLRDEGRTDWWVPVLFSRLRTGRSYFKAQFTGDGERLWQQLAAPQNTEYQITPVLGPGMSDEIIGPRQAIAERWAKHWQMPLAAHNREDLSKVAQYLKVHLRAPGAIAMRVAEYLREEIEQRVEDAHDRPDDPFHGVDADQPPQDAILAAGRRLLANDEGYAYRVVAGMPVPVYITTNWTPLLKQALEARTPRRTPETAYFEWTDHADWPKRPPKNFVPTVERPLIYHLFGRMDDPDSLVLTEDDYFEWLVAWVARRTTVPDEVQKRLTKRALMFLGYNLDDWDFKVVFQSIKSYPSSTTLLRRNAHVGVQLTPGTRDIDPESAQEYLESYLDSDNVGIYWSDTRRFLDEYRQRTGIVT